MTRALRSAGIALLAGLALTSMGGRAQAGIITFGLSVPDPVVAGSNFSVDIYLNEDGSAPYILETEGIIEAAFKLTFSNATLKGVQFNVGFVPKGSVAGL